ncbi:MAG: efflux RND transporter periplasmic adaptor subunit [Verrucomicrobiae bacterium]|nr:efflux RND transporter periplasmic adaptor subunit [Verrucomicrobiae bacterium]
MKKLTLAITLSVFAGFAIGFLVFRAGGDRHQHSNSDKSGESQTAGEEIWTCSMHPQIRQPKPGKCPICAMDLIPLSAMGGDAGERSYSMSEAAKKLAGITTVAVTRKNPEARVRLFGKVAYDETSMRSVAARFPARIDRLFVDYTGIRVEKGDHLATVYSPDLLSAQSELLTAKKFDNQKSVEVARDKLRLWGFSEDRIAEIESSGKTSDQLTIDAPLTGIVTHKSVNEGDYVQTGNPFFKIADLDEVWVMLDAYESDTPWLRFGQKVTFTTDSLPGKTFDGRVAFISPELNPATRTVSVRVNVPNETGLLKPGMFVSGIVTAKVAGAGQVLDPSLAGKWISPMHPEIVKDSPGKCDICGMDLVPAEQLGYVATQENLEPPLVIPASSVLHTGKRSIVYVELPDAEEPTFEGREILIGPRAGDQYIVEAGLREGEHVVAQGGFVIDSALQIQAKPSMMLPGEGGGERLFPEAPAPDEFLTGTDSLLDAYFAMQKGLANDSLEEAKTAGTQFTGRLESLPTDLLPTPSVEVWNDLGGRMKDSLEKLQGTGEIAACRIEFQNLTLLVDELVRRFGTDHLPVFTHYCPMAFDNAGGTWLQPNEDLVNPYFGEQMLNCGEVREQIAEAKAMSLGDTADTVIATLVDDYLGIQEALAGDSLEEAKAAAGHLRAQALELRKLEEPAAAKLGEQLAVQSELAEKRDDLAVYRVDFKEITGLVRTLVTRFGANLEKTLTEIHCPMAFNSVGADWIQEGDEVHNPYFGPSMLKCGEITSHLGNTAEEEDAATR